MTRFPNMATQVINFAPLIPRALLTALLAMIASGCQSTGGSHPEPLRAIDRKVDLNRFMGDWYVIAHIPAFIEDEAHNAVESYRLDEDGTIATTLRQEILR